MENRINAFARLGEMLRLILNGKSDTVHSKNIRDLARKIDVLIRDSVRYNGWFTETNVRYMIGSIAESLLKKNIENWLEPYLNSSLSYNAPKNIAVIMAGNIPVVGFHDFLSVLISGNKLIAKLSSDDNKILPAIANLLIAIEPKYNRMISFKEGKLTDFNAVIATGGNNASRYFEYYFGKFPNIIRRNRNGVAVLTGDETHEELTLLCDDIFLYYGLGCRNVSKLLVPEGYEFTKLLDVFSIRSDINENHKYFNNYEYNKAIYLVNNTPHFDSGNLMLVKNNRISSPVSVVYYENYNKVDVALKYIRENKENIQCVVSNINKVENRVFFGNSQQPDLWDYADGIDTMQFLLTTENQQV